MEPTELSTSETTSEGSAAENSALLDELAIAYEQLHLLHGLAAAVEDEIDHRMIFLRLVECLKELVPVQKAEVWIPANSPGDYRCLVHYDGKRIRSKTASIAISRGVRDQLTGMGVRVLRDRQLGRPLERFLLTIAEGIGVPAVAVPLVSKSKLVGLFMVAIPPTLESLDASRLKLIAAAGRQTSLSVHLYILVEELRANEGLRREIEIARQIQHNLLPQSIPQSQAFDLHAGCVTAARVGGDYYDFFQYPDGRMGLLVADVAGHSIASGLLAMSFRSAFRLFLQQGLELGALFEQVNAALHSELNQSGSFLSAIYGTFDEKTYRFAYVNGGHNPPLHWDSKEQRFRELTESGLLIGVLAGQTYRAAEVSLSPGDVILLYTDGIVEAENQQGEFFGMERLEEAVKKNLHKGSRELYHYLLKEMYIFQDEHFNKDDVTLVVLKIRE